MISSCVETSEPAIIIGYTKDQKNASSLLSIYTHQGTIYGDEEGNNTNNIISKPNERRYRPNLSMKPLNLFTNELKRSMELDAIREEFSRSKNISSQIKYQFSYQQIIDWMILHLAF